MKVGGLDGLSPEKVIEAVLSEHQPSRNPLVRGIWAILGTIFVVFAYIGVLVPGWPTTSWLVAAAFCFARSSQRLFRWLLTNPVFGKALLNYYRAGKALPLHSKIVIIGMLSVVSLLSIVMITKAGDPGFGQTLVGIVALLGVWFVGWKVPTIQ
jgi:uncharacterized membrane protein YbaN (DUF454 family)